MIPLLVVGVLSAGLSPATASKGDGGAMTKQWAGRYYLKGACAVTHAQNRFSWRIWLGRDSIPLREVQRRLPQVKKATRDYVRGEQKWIKHLRQPPAAWPRDVRSPVKRLARDNERYASLLGRAAKARSARAWGKWWRVAKGYDFHGDAKKIRERLDLPPSRSCGAQ